MAATLADLESMPVFTAPDAPRSEAFLNRIRLRARRRVLWMSASWPEGQSTERLAISTDEVNRILDASSVEAEHAFYQSDAIARQLTQHIHAQDLEFSRHPGWNRVRQVFGLSDFEVDLLSLAVALDLEPWLRRVYAYIQDDASSGGATPWLVWELFPAPVGHGRPSAMALLESRLARPADDNANASAANASWIADPYIANWLEGRRGIDPVLNSFVRLASSSAVENSPSLYPDLLGVMLEFARLGASSPATALQIEIAGAEGTGKRTLARQFAAALGADLLAVDADALLAAETPAAAEDRVMRCLRMARLEGAVLYWHGSTAISSRLWRMIGAGTGLIVVGSERPGGAVSRSPGPRRTFELPPLASETRIVLWKRLTALPPPDVIAASSLTPAEVVAAAQVAAAGPEAVAEVCQSNLRIAPGDLFAPLECPFTWDDIVLPHYLRQHLAELQQQVGLRCLVYEDWGFKRLCPLTRGITALFAGPSGTGKTMAAQILARALGMRLYRVDLAGVVNKYIGETEKRLKQVFDVCERANVVLFFDEADALFGQRTQVKDAHDRFANIEIDYLLQRMEQFDGVAILATNRKGDLDKAFVRRLRFIVDFVPPGPAERHALWRRCLLAHSPGGEDLLGPIDWDLLVDKLNMTGADITATALGAAFLARAENSRIAMRHVLHAARRQLNKQGIATRAGDLEG